MPGKTRTRHLKTMREYQGSMIRNVEFVGDGCVVEEHEVQLCQTVGESTAASIRVDTL